METRERNRRFARRRPRIARHPVRLTALLYLREALLEERYEDCAELIAAAKEFGGDALEIRFLLEDPRRPVVFSDTPPRGPG